MTKGQRQVKEFMEFFGQNCPEKPIIPTEQVAMLRAKLILEEALETIVKGLGLRAEFTDPWVNGQSLKRFVDNIEFVKEAEPDLVELTDGLADLAYVGEFGTSVAVGIDLEPIQDHVHGSNMSKAWKKEDLGKVPEGYPVEEFKHTGLYRVKRPDGKVLKSPSYHEANILPLIQAQLNPSPVIIDDIYSECVTCPNCGQTTYHPEFGCNECGITVH